MPAVLSNCDAAAEAAGADAEFADQPLAAAAFELTLGRAGAAQPPALELAGAVEQ